MRLRGNVVKVEVILKTEKTRKKKNQFSPNYHPPIEPCAKPHILADDYIDFINVLHHVYGIRVVQNRG